MSNGFGLLGLLSLRSSICWYFSLFRACLLYLYSLDLEVCRRRRRLLSFTLGLEYLTSPYESRLFSQLRGQRAFDYCYILEYVQRSLVQSTSVFETCNVLRGAGAILTSELLLVVAIVVEAPLVAALRLELALGGIAREGGGRGLTGKPCGHRCCSNKTFLFGPSVRVCTLPICT